jgi:hypothetical protein
MSEAEPARPNKADAPPRAFTQGVGQVYQVVGVLLFLSMMFVCCGSSLLSKDWATRSDLTKIGWGQSANPNVAPRYSAQRALTISLFTGVFCGLALAGIGLGLQAEHRGAPWFAVAVTSLATPFWLIHFAFAVTLRSGFFAVIAGALAAGFIVLGVLGVAALREMRRNPPLIGHEVLPKDYKVPYSHYHEDPPEVRLARELEQRRERLAVQQKELQMLEDRLTKRIEEEKQCKREQADQ